MRVGILTFHGSSNPGALWQTIATCQSLRRLGHSATVIDYRTPLRHQRSKWHPLRHARCLKSPLHLLIDIGWRAAADISRRDLPIGRPILTREQLAGERYDAVVIGSDVVWESPADPVYLGATEFVETERLIAYAASAGHTDAAQADLPVGMQRPCPFKAISVRDSNTMRWLDRAGWSKDAVMISDPTVALRVPPVGDAAVLRKPYLLVYCSSRPSEPVVSAIREYARKHHLTTVAAFYPQRWVERNLPFVTARRWMSLLAKADAVVTNTFHGAVLSCLLDRPLAVVNLSEKTSLKSIDQFKSLAIDRRLAVDAEDVPAALSRRWSGDEQALREGLVRANEAFLARALGTGLTLKAKELCRPAEQHV